MKPSIYGLADFVEKDLPHTSVNVYEDFSSNGFILKISCNITKRELNSRVDKYYSNDTDYLRILYENARREIIRVRGEHYTDNYKGPQGFNKEFQVYLDEYPLCKPNNKIDEESNKKEQRKKKLSALKNYGLF